MPIRLKRAYEDASEDDGQRVLVDRLWPRGVSREEASLSTWMKEIAPSDELRRWFNHDPERWEGFKRRHFEELDSNPEVQGLRLMAKDKMVTLVHASKDEEHNNAVALREYLGVDS